MDSRSSSIHPIDEDARRRFETAWIEGSPAPFEQFLPDTAHDGYLSTLEELICIEMEFTWKAWNRGEGIAARPTQVAAYLDRYPALDRPEVRNRLLEEELRIRRIYGDDPSRANFAHGRATLSESHAVNETAVMSPADSDLPNVPGYETYGLLGRGGMGVVLKARQLSLGRIVALKMILLGGAGRSQDSARLRMEAEAVAKLHHPNVVQIYEVAEHNGCPFLTLEYMNGGSLSAWSKGLPQSPRAAAGLLVTIARAIHHAHQRGIIHRDLKPANILLQRIDEKSAQPQPMAIGDARLIPKVADFGLAKVLGETQTQQTQTGAILGTPCYMAPEQAGGPSQDVGIPADIYALGAILYDLLTGRPPFQGQNPLETLEQVRIREPVPPRKVEPGIPPDLETICLACLAKDPARRYSSAQALADDLERYRNGEPILARPSTRRERLLKWIRRRPAQAALIGVSGLAAVTLLIVVLADNVRLEHQRNIANENQQKAEEQRKRAIAHYRRARAAADSLLTRISDQRLSEEPYMEALRLDLLKEALRAYEGFAIQEMDDPELRLETVRIHRRLGYLNGEVGMANDAERSYRAALGLAEELRSESPNNEELLAELSSCENNLANFLLTKPDADRSETFKLISRNVEKQEKLYQLHPDNITYAEQQSGAYDARARWFANGGQPVEAEKNFRQSLKTMEAVPMATRSLGFAQTLSARRRNFAVLLGNQKRLPEAEPLFQSEQQFWEKQAENSPTTPRFQGRAGDANFNLGNLLSALGRNSEAETCLRKSVDHRKILVDEYPKIPRYRDELADARDKLARIFINKKEFPKACAILEQEINQIEANQKYYGLTPHQREVVSSAIWLLADCQIQLGDYQNGARTAEKLPLLSKDNWRECYQASRLLTRCVTLAGRDRDMGESARRTLVDSYAARAVEYLRESVKRGCPELAFAKKDAGLDVLRSRDDFKKLMAEWSAKAPKKP